ncbi:MAG: thioredoxin [Phycisphaerae bacterium]
MASQNVLELTVDNFDQAIIASDKPALVDVWADYCVPCKMLAPTIEELAGEYAGRVVFGKVDAESQRDIPMRYGISRIPTLLLFKGGEVVKKLIGLQNKKDIKAVIDSLL